LAFYNSLGFDGDRTHKNLFGYPGLLRELSNPPPWVEVEPEDLNGDLAAERAHELRALILQTQSSRDEELVTLFRDELKRITSPLRRLIGFPSVSALTIDTGLNPFVGYFARKSNGRRRICESL